ncbi:Bys1 family protein [Nannizzia gypsea CBS 118893]|uniref:Bys1 family protein n=1 Tax=Arthroderma gypseum (strain ATCC MYA-4604 / CBS 118893) TaxID=535722 RepID=E5R0X1_ARTGP|nr:Bys1 family protein [Nannizzia gypsea CBS 118893]EFQ98413.1 Bys1 family protein [Nannizzia gypsea CBS 118893]
MQFKAIALTAIAAITPFTAAVGHAIVENHCDNNAYLWSVGSSVGPQQTITPGHTYSEQFRYDPVSGGIALKITRAKDGIYNGSPQTIFAYTLTNTNTFYDLSDVFGDAFAGTSGLLVSTSNPNCPDIWWPNGVPPAGQKFTSACQRDADITLTLCAQPTKISYWISMY